MGFFQLPENLRERGNDWELRLFVLLSLFLQLILTSHGKRRKFIFRNWIQIVVRTTYLADSIATLTLGIISNRLANIKETKGMIDPKSQITAFWAPFLLLHLGGTDQLTAFALVDLELWQRQLVQLCVQVGLTCSIYSTALLGSSVLSILAAGMILVGFISYAERTLCLYWASKDPLRDSMLPRRESKSTKEEGYRVGVHEITQIPGPEDLPVSSGQARKEDGNLAQAYELFKIFKVLFVGLAVNFVDLEASRRIFMGQHMDPVKAFKIVEIELGFMYDLLFTKAPLLGFAWGIVRYVINLSVLGTVLIFFSLQDKKDYPTVDICITFLLPSVAILLAIYSFLQAISSDWIQHWRLQRRGRSAISSAIAHIHVGQSHRWSNAVGQFYLLRLSVGKRNKIFRHPRLAKLHMVVEKNFYIDYKTFRRNIKGLIFDRMRDMVERLEQTSTLKSGVASLKLEASDLLKKSNCDHLSWSLDKMEFDQSILIWHIATELCYNEDRGGMQGEDIENSEMGMLVSQYMLYLLLFYPSMLPTGIGMVRYEDTLDDAQKFFDDKLATLSTTEGSISSVVIEWAHKLFKKEARVHTCFGSCKKQHTSRESRDLCYLCHILLQGTELPAWKIRGDRSTSVLFDACRLAGQLKSVDTWDIISKVWVRLLVYAACQCKGYEHCEGLSRGGELLAHVWLPYGASRHSAAGTNFRRTNHYLTDGGVEVPGGMGRLVKRNVWFERDKIS